MVSPYTYEECKQRCTDEHPNATQEEIDRCINDCTQQDQSTAGSGEQYPEGQKDYPTNEPYQYPTQEPYPTGSTSGMSNDECINKCISMGRTYEVCKSDCYGMPTEPYSYPTQGEYPKTAEGYPKEYPNPEAPVPGGWQPQPVNCKEMCTSYGKSGPDLDNCIRYCEEGQQHMPTAMPSRSPYGDCKMQCYEYTKGDEKALMDCLQAKCGMTGTTPSEMPAQSYPMPAMREEKNCGGMCAETVRFCVDNCANYAKGDPASSCNEKCSEMKSRCMKDCETGEYQHEEELSCEEMCQRKGHEDIGMCMEMCRKHRKGEHEEYRDFFEKCKEECANAEIPDECVTARCYKQGGYNFGDCVSDCKHKYKGKDAEMCIQRSCKVVTPDGYAYATCKQKCYAAYEDNKEARIDCIEQKCVEDNPSEKEHYFKLRECGEKCRMAKNPEKCFTEECQNADYEPMIANEMGHVCEEVERKKPMMEHMLEKIKAKGGNVEKARALFDKIIAIADKACKLYENGEHQAAAEMMQDAFRLGEEMMGIMQDVEGKNFDEEEHEDMLGAMLEKWKIYRPELEDKISELAKSGKDTSEAKALFSELDAVMAKVKNLYEAGNSKEAMALMHEQAFPIGEKLARIFGEFHEGETTTEDRLEKLERLFGMADSRIGEIGKMLDEFAAKGIDTSEGKEVLQSIKEIVDAARALYSEKRFEDAFEKLKEAFVFDSKLEQLFAMYSKTASENPELAAKQAEELREIIDNAKEKLPKLEALLGSLESLGYDVSKAKAAFEECKDSLTSVEAALNADNVDGARLLLKQAIEGSCGELKRIGEAISEAVA